MSAVKLLEDITNSYRLVKCQWQNAPSYVLKKAQPIIKTKYCIDLDGAARIFELIDGRRFQIEIKEIR